MAIIEAMSVGLPVLVSSVRGSLDCIVPNKSGFAYAPYDIEGFSKGLYKLYNMKPDEVLDISKFNKEYAQKFNISNSLERMFDIYIRSGVM